MFSIYIDKSYEEEIRNMQFQLGLPKIENMLI